MFLGAKIQKNLETNDGFSINISRYQKKQPLMQQIIKYSLQALKRPWRPLAFFSYIIWKIQIFFLSLRRNIIEENMCTKSLSPAQSHDDEDLIALPEDKDYTPEELRKLLIDDVNAFYGVSL